MYVAASVGFPNPMLSLTDDRYVLAANAAFSFERLGRVLDINSRDEDPRQSFVMQRGSDGLAPGRKAGFSAQNKSSV
jgi:hypothetical protein